MDSLEDYTFLASNNKTAENVLYFFSSALVVIDVVATVILFAIWLHHGGDYPIDFVFLICSFFATVFFWAFVMVFLKISNLLRHIYNRLDDSVLNAEEKQPEEETEE